MNLDRVSELRVCYPLLASATTRIKSFRDKNNWKHNLNKSCFGSLGCFTHPIPGGPGVIKIGGSEGIQSSPCISNVLKLRRLNLLHHIKRCSIDLKFWLNLLNSYLVDRSKILVELIKVIFCHGF